MAEVKWDLLLSVVFLFSWVNALFLAMTFLPFTDLHGLSLSLSSYKNISHTLSLFSLPLTFRLSLSSFFSLLHFSHSLSFLPLTLTLASLSHSRFWFAIWGGHRSALGGWLLIGISNGGGIVGLCGGGLRWW